MLVQYFICMKVWDCLPKEATVLACMEDVREIRIRDGRPIFANVAGHWYAVGEKGLMLSGGPIPTVSCDEIVQNACNHSVYAYEKMLASGFFTLEDGVRVGVCGQLSGSDKTVFRKYTSLCFRVPRLVHPVSREILQKCTTGNVVVIGPPASGKTTFLRDLAMKLSQNANVLVADERGEIFFDESVQSTCNCDVLKWSNKQYAFDVGVRTMSPQWIVCDELTASDESVLLNALNSGVNVACSVHGRNTSDFCSKFSLCDKFSTAVVLSDVGGNVSVIDLNRPDNSEN